MADKLHNYYKGQWWEKVSENLKGCWSKDLEKLLGYFDNSEYDESEIRTAIPKWIRLLDPNMLHSTEYADKFFELTYEKIQGNFKFLDKNIRDIILGFTVGGRMTATIEYAKKNKNNPNMDSEYSAYKSKFADPSSEWFHDKFAKDLFSICPQWAKKLLKGEEEKQELLELWMSKHKRLPDNSEDRNWVIPKGHRLFPYFSLNYKIEPYPYTVFTRLGSEGQWKMLIESQLKKDIKPGQWGAFKKQYPASAEKLEKKYPKIINLQQWHRNNLTKVQQERIDKWKKVEQILLRPETDEELFSKLTKHEKKIVTNLLKNFNSKFGIKRQKFTAEKLLEHIDPIRENIRKARPNLVEMYANSSTDNKTFKGYYLMGPGANTKKQMETIYKLAKTDIAWSDLDRSTRYSISKLTNKTTSHSEFSDKLRKLRPDWFDEKLRKQIIRERFIANKKEIVK